MGRYIRVDGRKSWNYPSSIILVLVVSACLIGTWITISSLVDSAKNFEISVGLIKDVKLQMVNEKHSREFEAKLGDFPEDGVNGNIGHIRGNDSLVQTKNAGVEVTDSGTSAQIRAGSMQTAELEKPRVTKKMYFLKDQKGYYVWKLCNVTAGSDYIPCLDNIKAIRKLPSISHYEHRERHCPDQAPTCLVSVPKGYKTSLPWPKSRDKVTNYFVEITVT